LFGVHQLFDLGTRIRSSLFDVIDLGVGLIQDALHVAQISIFVLLTTLFIFQVELTYSVTC